MIWLLVCWVVVVAASPIPEGYKQTSVGLMHSECIHSFPNLKTVHFTQEGDVAEMLDGSKLFLPPCTQPRLTVEKTPVENQKNLKYYSSWVAYAGYTHPTEFSFFTSTWTVPPSPPSPFFLTTVFFFNGIQQQLHNTTAIYQPVLQYGFSGCGGGEYWTLTAFVVSDSGRAYCGQMLNVNENDVVRGNMTKQTDGSWLTQAEVLNRSSPVSHISATSPLPMRFACLTMEAIRLYSCGEYPGNNAMTFTNNHLFVGDQELTPPAWQRYIIHNECGQSVAIGSGSTPDVTILYDSKNTTHI
eukprot:TRINITY_DN656_c0_g1_i2.p1 TRINITY_DN656_c0_g1~~TRINITY_DN656_c0_g1_i2.p1  ORF type:complete len:299 (-),score=71.86 TRINITY_DN656_c0_g1_i2:30-926(-)